MDFLGKYRLGDRIARGGMAEVYRAQVIGAAGFAREIAVKRILPELVEDEEFREMFKEEAKLAARLDHPNIVQIFDFDHVGDSFYIAMEYVNGADFSRLMASTRRSGTPLDPRMAAFVICEVLAGLRHAHDLTDKAGRPLGIVHRDISPANILLSYSGAVKLADFGIAKAATSLVHTEGGILKGKYPFMSPEQAAGRPLDNRSDLFAVGIVLYQALVGRRPFVGSTAGEVFSSLRAGVYVPARRSVPSLPEAVEQVIATALRVDPADRYQSAADFLSDLRDAFEPLPTREDLERYLKHWIPETPRPASSGTGRRDISTVTHEAPPDSDASASPPEGQASADTAREVASETKPMRRAAEGAAVQVHLRDGATSDAAGSAGRERTSERAFVEAATERLADEDVLPMDDRPASTGDAAIIAEEAPTTVRDVRLQPSRWGRLAGAAAIIAVGVALILSGVVMLWREGEGSPSGRDAATSGARETFTVLARRSADQWTELRAHGLDKTLRARGLELRQLEYNAYPKLLELLRSEQIDLVSAPLSVSRALTAEELILTVDRIAEERLKGVRARFTVPALKVGVIDTALGTRMAFVPEYLEAHVMVYRVSKVALARERWREFRPSIEEALAEVNGRGLPAGYDLEADPSEWDEFDLFVAGYTWTRLDEGNPQPRLAFRTQSYWPSVEDLVERATLHGQTHTTLSQGQPLLDVLTWLALHKAHGLERPEVWARRPDDRPSGTSVTQWIAWDSVYLARVNQFRCAELREHLREHQMRFGLDDLAFAPLPAGVSVELDAEGRPLRSGNHLGLVNSWLWAVPRNARDPQRSLDVALDLVDIANQTYFASRNCWIPSNNAVDTSAAGPIDPFCRRGMSPAADTLERGWFVYNPPNLETFDEDLQRFERLWTDLFARRGYLVTAGDGGTGTSTISVERIRALMEQHVPPG